MRWNLGWLGALLLVLAILAFIGIRGRFWSDTSENWAFERDDIRAYYRSEDGGEAPESVAARIGVSRCEFYDGTRGYRVDRCFLTFGTLRPHPCFQFSGTNVGFGPLQLPRIAGCDLFVYDRARRTMRVVPRR